MKRLVSIFYFVMLFSLEANASNLLNYIEEPILMANLQHFSANGLSFKRCSECDLIFLKPESPVSYLENGESINLERALQLYFAKELERLSVFYFRDVKRYNVVSFGSVPEVITDEAIELNGQGEK